MVKYEEALALMEYSRLLRRDFHMNPELGFQEVRTAGIVAEELHKSGFEVTTGVAKTGVVATLDGEHPGPVVLVRFDMDALPIQEETGAVYTSQTPGVMHACGHDGHTAVGLTVAKLLRSYTSEMAGTVKFIFQPAEEGLGGALGMIAGGVLENPKPDFVYALHLWNEKPLGWLGISPGPVMAASEVFKVQITGRGGHGALPHLAIDPVLAAAQTITALQSIASRSISPLRSAVVTVASVHAGEAHNVIPQTAFLKGTIRSFEKEDRERVLERFYQIVEGTAQTMGCLAEIDLQSLTPAVINHPESTRQLSEVAARLFPGIDIDAGFKTTGSEDMAYMMQDIPGCYFFVGSANKENGLDAPHHHPKFDFDEAALPRAAALMAAAVLDRLQ